MNGLEPKAACRRRRGGQNRALGLLALAATAIAFALYRRWHLRWGATADEVAASMPGDEFFPGAGFEATRAIRIDAPPEAVWPWLAQVGFGRAGFYSYDLLDNLGRRSAERIVPGLQALAVGDWIPMMAGRPTERTAFRVRAFEEPRWMLWAKPDSSWAWRLEPAGDGATRLVTRVRCRYSLRDFPGVLLTIPLLELADFPMMRRMLLGMKHRAERLARETAE
jgi:hypothetical protein